MCIILLLPPMSICKISHNFLWEEYVIATTGINHRKAIFFDTDISKRPHFPKVYNIYYMITFLSAVPSKSYSPFSIALAVLFIVPTTTPNDNLKI